MNNFLDSMIIKLGEKKFSLLFAFVYSILLTIIVGIMEIVVFNKDFVIIEAIVLIIIFYFLGLKASKSLIKNCTKK